MGVGPTYAASKPFKQSVIETLGHVWMFKFSNAKLLVEKVRPFLFVNKDYYPELNRNLKDLGKATTLLGRAPNRTFAKGNYAKAIELSSLKAEAHNLRAQLYERITQFNFACEEYKEEGLARDLESASHKILGDEKGYKEAYKKSKEAFANADKAFEKAEEKERADLLWGPY